LSRPRDEDAYCRTQINLRRSLDWARRRRGKAGIDINKANALW
jgi:hypothetical protein